MSAPYAHGSGSIAMFSQRPVRRIATIDGGWIQYRYEESLLIESTQVVTISRDADGYVRVEVREYEEEERIL